jgi:hypothetical protein
LLRKVRIAAVMAAFFAICSVGTATAASDAPGHALRYKGAPHSLSTGNLVDNGGAILPASHTYAIFWGPSAAWSSDVFTGIGDLFNGFNGSSYLGTAQQYMRVLAPPISSAYQGPKYDISGPPRRVSSSTLGAEVQKVYKGTVDPSGIYFVYTSNFPNGGGFCAWHSYATVNGTRIAVAYMPNTTNVAGCDGGNEYGDSSHTQGLYSLANVTAHEFMEAVTDPYPGNGTYAWIDQSGSEIGDKCAWQFSGTVTLSNKTRWQLQEEWSNAVSGCVQG